ncbi:hypothetical protein BU25DRAFT_449937 [Macroventuria anomochaeta]|uniref:Uncharacterized protein n=1 Tax=Macroventuria anomochaeta TaxID=301207 RepID=A0ACB6RU36_9PLEO|nr:uncharacterized protein BU25DRAFT_449937 [Macroventuria anomochaeta]KAF2625520.1 hypothetical protein BU25DRAFT_449937 [Macroventuria anomochaeta]
MVNVYLASDPNFMLPWTSFILGLFIGATGLCFDLASDLLHSAVEPKGHSEDQSTNPRQIHTSARVVKFIKNEAGPQTDNIPQPVDGIVQEPEILQSAIFLGDKSRSKEPDMERSDPLSAPGKHPDSLDDLCDLESYVYEQEADRPFTLQNLLIDPICELHCRPSYSVSSTHHFRMARIQAPLPNHLRYRYKNWLTSSSCSCVATLSAKGMLTCLINTTFEISAKRLGRS